MAASWIGSLHSLTRHVVIHGLVPCLERQALLKVVALRSELGDGFTQLRKLSGQTAVSRSASLQQRGGLMADCRGINAECTRLETRTGVAQWSMVASMSFCVDLSCMRLRTKLFQAVGKATLGAIAALSLFVPNAESLLKKHFCRPKLIIAMREATIRVIAATLSKCLAYLSPAQVRYLMYLLK